MSPYLEGGAADAFVQMVPFISAGLAVAVVVFIVLVFFP